MLDKILDQPMTEIERAGAGAGIGCGMFIWAVAWAAVAGPALAIYSVSGKKSDNKQVDSIRSMGFL